MDAKQCPATGAGHLTRTVFRSAYSGWKQTLEESMVPVERSWAARLSLTIATISRVARGRFKAAPGGWRPIGAIRSASGTRTANSGLRLEGPDLKIAAVDLQQR